MDDILFYFLLFCIAAAAAGPQCGMVWRGIVSGEKQLLFTLIPSEARGITSEAHGGCLSHFFKKKTSLLNPAKHFCWTNSSFS